MIEEAKQCPQTSLHDSKSPSVSYFNNCYRTSTNFMPQEAKIEARLRMALSLQNPAAGSFAFHRHNRCSKILSFQSYLDVKLAIL
jgi:hypothetical protein